MLKSVTHGSDLKVPSLGVMYILMEQPKHKTNYVDNLNIVDTREYNTCLYWIYPKYCS